MRLLTWPTLLIFGRTGNCSALSTEQCSVAPEDSAATIVCGTGRYVHNVRFSRLSFVRHCPKYAYGREITLSLPLR